MATLETPVLFVERNRPPTEYESNQRHHLVVGIVQHSGLFAFVITADVARDRADDAVKLCRWIKVIVVLRDIKCCDAVVE
jgi:hypothetical protein